MLLCGDLTSPVSPSEAFAHIKYLVANFIDNLYDDDESESGSGWISWFCDLEGHEFFIEVLTNSNPLRQS